MFFRVCMDFRYFHYYFYFPTNFIVYCIPLYNWKHIFLDLAKLMMVVILYVVNKVMHLVLVFRTCAYSSNCLVETTVTFVSVSLLHSYLLVYCMLHSDKEFWESHGDQTNSPPPYYNQQGVKTVQKFLSKSGHNQSEI